MAMSALRSFGVGAVGALLVLIAAALIVPLYSDYTARSRAHEALTYLKSAQDRISARAMERGTLVGSGVGIAENSESPLRETTISTDGTIIARVAYFGQVIVLIPKYSHEKITWRCIAGSAKDVPLQCRA